MVCMLHGACEHAMASAREKFIYLPSSYSKFCQHEGWKSGGVDKELGCQVRLPHRAGVLGGPTVAQLPLGM